MTIMARRKLEGVDQEYGVDVGAEETAGRLIQHVESLFCDQVVIRFLIMVSL